MFDEIWLNFGMRSGAKVLEQRALCTFFSLPPQASLHCCGLMVSSPGPCASSGGRLPEALFMVFLSDSKGPKVCKDA